MNYFFGKKYPNQNDLIILENEEAHHCAVVLRLKEGDKVGVLEPNINNELAANIYIATLTEVHKKNCIAKIESVAHYTHPSLKVHLIISPPKNNERLEWLVEKSVELQASSLLFVKSERCIRKTLNIERLLKVSIAAAKQSINPVLPTIESFNSLKELLHTFSANKNKEKILNLLLHCEPSELKKDLNIHLLNTIKEKNYTNIYVFIGPEGDWTKDEINKILSISENTVELSLGNTRLRTETAAISILSALRSI